MSDSSSDDEDKDFLLTAREREMKTAGRLRRTVPTRSKPQQAASLTDLNGFLAEEKKRRERLAAEKLAQEERDRKMNLQHSAELAKIGGGTSQSNNIDAVVRQKWIQLGMLCSFAHEDLGRDRPLPSSPAPAPQEGAEARDEVWAALRRDIAEEVNTGPILATRIPALLSAEHGAPCPLDVCLWLVGVAVGHTSDALAELAVANLASLIVGKPDLTSLNAVSGWPRAVQEFMEGNGRAPLEAATPRPLWKPTCALFTELLEWCGMRPASARLAAIKQSGRVLEPVEDGEASGNLHYVVQLLEICSLAKHLDLGGDGASQAAAVRGLAARLMLLMVDPVALSVCATSASHAVEALLDALPDALATPEQLHLVALEVLGFLGSAEKGPPTTPRQSPVQESESPGQAEDLATMKVDLALCIAAQIRQDRPRCAMLKQAMVLASLFDNAAVSKDIPAACELLAVPQICGTKSVDVIRAEGNSEVLAIARALTDQIIQTMGDTVGNTGKVELPPVVCRTLNVLVKAVSELLLAVHGKVEPGDIPLREAIYQNLCLALDRFPTGNSVFIGLVLNLVNQIKALSQKYIRFKASKVKREPADSFFSKKKQASLDGFFARGSAAAPDAA